MQTVHILQSIFRLCFNLWKILQCQHKCWK